MSVLTDLTMDDVDVYNKQPSSIYRRYDRIDQLFTCAASRCIHGIFHHVSTTFVNTLELRGIQCGLVVIAGPNMMHLTTATYQKLVDIFGRTPNMGIGRTVITLLVTSQAADATAFAADIAGRQSNINERAYGAVVVIAPDDAFS
jgi:hypothetical protein